MYVRARTPVQPSLETKHLHEPGEDAESRGERNDPPGTTQLCRVLERWQIEMIRAPTRHFVVETSGLEPPIPCLQSYAGRSRYQR